jgi:hypothetical protein
LLPNKRSVNAKWRNVNSVSVMKLVSGRLPSGSVNLVIVMTAPVNGVVVIGTSVALGMSVGDHLQGKKINPGEGVMLDHHVSLDQVDLVIFLAATGQVVILKVTKTTTRVVAAGDLLLSI